MRKLAWAAGAFSAAVFAACFVLPDGWRLYAALAALLLGLGGLLLHGDKRHRVLLAACFAALGLAWTQVHTLCFIEPAQALDGTEQTVTLRVTDYPKDGGSYTSFSARLVTPGLPRTRVTVYVNADGANGLRPGDVVEADLRFHTALLRYDEAIWSYAAKGVYLTANTDAAPRVTGQWALRFLYTPKRLAEGVKAQVRRHFPQDAVPFMTALLTGDRTLLYRDGQLYSAMQRAGLMHIVAVSGMHISFLIGFLQLFLGHRRRTALLCIPVILVFIPMAGGSPSVIRAGFMQILILLAPLFGRESDSSTALLTALALLLAVNPQSARSTSLQLSFASMAGILFLAPRMYSAMYGFAEAKGWTKGRKRQAAARCFISSLSTSLGALALSTPILALSFGSVSIIAPLTNLLCLSVLSLCFSAGFVCCILGAVLPFLATALGWLLAWGLRFVMLVTKALGAWRFACVYTENGFIAVWLIAVYIILILCWCFRGKRGFRPTVPLCTGICLLLCAVCATRISDAKSALRFTALDVGQGQCLVLQSAGETVLLDCGGSSGFSAGAAAADYLDSRFLRGADTLILTHLHEDHAGGVETLLQRVPVRRIILPADADDGDALLAEIEAAAQRAGTELLYLERDSLLTFGEAELTLYAPLGGSGENERGTAILGRCGDFDFLVTGDMNSTGERRLMRHAALPQTELLVVGHHGSRYSSSPELLSQLQPETAIISVGGNSYGHPTEETLARLAAYGADVYRTDHSGSITLCVPK